MKRKAHPNKLSLSRETLHMLDREHLKAVAAAYNYSTSPDLCPTRVTKCGC